MQPRIVAIVVVVVLVLAGLVYWAMRTEEPPAPAPTPVEQPEPETAAPEAEPMFPESTVPAPPPLPPLNDSDDFVREQVRGLSERLDDWMSRDDLVRRFAVVVDNAALGEIPRRQLGFLAPSGKYPVRQDGEQLFVDAVGYRRFDAVVDNVVSLPAEQAAALLRTIAPLLRESLAELGHREPDPIAAVKAGIRQALQTPEPDGEIELVQPKVLYQYADPGLESLPPLQKQLLRMGPDNLAKLKAYLREVQEYL